MSPYTKPKYLCNNLIYNAIVLNSALHNNRLGKKKKNHQLCKRSIIVLRGKCVTTRHKNISPTNKKRVGAIQSPGPWFSDEAQWKFVSREPRKNVT